VTPRQVEVIAAELRPRGWHVWASGGFCYAAGPGYSPGLSQTVWATNLADLIAKVRSASPKPFST
jgi:hypothetical protein